MTLGQELAALRRYHLADLQVRFAEVFGEPTTVRNKAWLVKRIAWRLQANAEGSLTDRARQRIAELANDSDLRVMPPKNLLPTEILQPVEVAARASSEVRLPMPGTVLTRPYKGAQVRVAILESGFEYEGVVYKSLSAVAKAITGSHCNGYHFFRLRRTP